MILRTSPNFRSLWLGQSVSVIGDGMQRVALLWWAHQVGGTSLVTLIALCTVIPVVLCSPMGGSFADRFDRRTLLLGADLLRFGVTAVLATLVLGGNSSTWPPIPLVCALVAASAVGTAIFDPAYAAAVPTVVPAEDRPAANGLNMTNSAVGGLAGPLVGGVLIASMGVGPALVVNACTFAWSLLCIWLTSLPAPAGAASAGTSEGRGALREVLRDRHIRGLIGLAAVLNMVAAPIPVLIVALAVDRFRVGAEAFGVLQIMISVGILIGSLAAAKLAQGPLATPMFVLGACLGVVGVLPFAGSAAVLLVGGVAIAVANTILITTFQNTVPEETQGRVFGALGAVGEGLRPVGLLLAAPLLAIAGVSGAFVVVGFGVILATLAWLLTSRPVSHVDPLVDQRVDGLVGPLAASGSTGSERHESVTG